MCGFLLNSLPQAMAAEKVHMSISNSDDSVILYDTSGTMLNSGSAMLGTLAGAWSYDSQGWFDGSKYYTQEELSYSQLASISNSFATATLTNMAPESNGSISEGGMFSLSGNYETGSSFDGKSMYIKIASDSGFSIFLLQSAKDTPLLFPSTRVEDLVYDWQTEAAADLEFPYYVTCILGGHRADGGFQLLVPEPATATLGLLGLAALMMRRRRQ